MRMVTLTLCYSYSHFYFFNFPCQRERFYVVVGPDRDMTGRGSDIIALGLHICNELNQTARVISNHSFLSMIFGVYFIPSTEYHRF